MAPQLIGLLVALIFICILLFVVSVMIDKLDQYQIIIGLHEHCSNSLCHHSYRQGFKDGLKHKLRDIKGVIG